MKILLVAATENEIGLLREKLNEALPDQEIEFLVTGVGMVNTTYALTRRLTRHEYDLAINVGLAGSFDADMPLGTVVAIYKDEFYELGAEDGQDFIPADVMGLIGSRDVVADFPITDHPFRLVSAITVNKVHGNENSIRMVIEKSEAIVESMEGAAFYFVCNQERVKCLQIRAVSNRVERRNRDAWNIPLALASLTDSVFGFLKGLKS